MKACFLAMLSLVFVSVSSAQLLYTKQQIIAYAKSIDVQMLDPSLPSQRLEDWLQSGPPHAHIGYWIVADSCDLKDPEVPYPLCARLSFYREGQTGNRYGQQGYLLIQVGNSKDGRVGQRTFSKGQFPGYSHQHDGLGAFLSPYFVPNDESCWWEESRPEPAGSGEAPEVVYAPSERERPPADAQVIEMPVAPNQKEERPPLPAIFVLINGERIETQRFVLTVSSLSVNIDRRERVIPLEAVDLGATSAANLERGINLRIPADQNGVSLSF